MKRIKAFSKYPAIIVNIVQKLQVRKKGNAVGIYIHEKFQSNRLEKFRKSSPNLESLFVEITNTEVPQIIGGVYSPPSGDVVTALSELEKLMTILPEKNVSTTSDYNIDLLSHSSQKGEFEQILYSHNFIPLISLNTHKKPGCRDTLIDNILVNTTKNHSLWSHRNYHFTPPSSFLYL
jgi:hypothetical protein